AASCMTAAFARTQRLAGGEYAHALATFDARAFNVPENEIVNYFLWRAKDWARNSLSMYCQSIFSHQELQGKNAPHMHEMLFAKGRNWARDLCNDEKNGTFLIAPANAVSANCDTNRDTGRPRIVGVIAGTGGGAGGGGRECSACSFDTTGRTVLAVVALAPARNGCARVSSPGRAAAGRSERNSLRLDCSQ